MADSTGNTGSSTEVSNGTPENTASTGVSNQENTKGTPPRDGQGRFRADGQREQEGEAGHSGGHQAQDSQASRQAQSDADQAEAWLRNKRKVKVNGTEREVTAEEAFSRYQLTQAAHERMQKAAEMEKQLKAREQQLQQHIKQNPLEFVERLLGPEQARRLYEQRVTQALEWDLKRPEERERQMLQQERQQFEQQRKAYQQQQHQQQVAKHSEKYQQEYATAFPKALEAAGLPATKEYIKEMAIVAQNMLKAGIQWTPEEAAKVVAENEGERQRRFIEGRRQKLSGLAEEQLFERLREDYGDEVLNKFRKADVSRLKPKQSAEVSYKRAQTAQQPGQRPMTIEELRERMQKRNGY